VVCKRIIDRYAGRSEIKVKLPLSFETEGDENVGPLLYLPAAWFDSLPTILINGNTDAMVSHLFRKVCARSHLQHLKHADTALDK
jgi:hypothetical protein